MDDQRDYEEEEYWRNEIERQAREEAAFQGELDDNQVAAHGLNRLDEDEDDREMDF